MANITWLGASYSNVPWVTLPKTGGGTALFSDVSDTTAAAADVASGKYFYTSAGTRTQGTSSGGGVGTLLTTKSLGTVSTSSTSATDTGQTVLVSSINSYDLLIVETSVDSVVNNRHEATVQLIVLTAGTNVTTKKDGATLVTNTQNIKISSSGVATSRQSTTKYGVYVNSTSIGASGLTLTMYKRYNNTQTGTVNGSYTVRVYGVSTYDLIGG